MLNFSSLENFFDFSELNAENVAKIHKIVTIIVAICVAFVASKIISSVFEYIGQDALKVPRVRTINKNNKEQEKQAEYIDYEIIVKRNIFNSLGTLPDEEIIKPEDAGDADASKKSDLPIELVGTIVVNDPSRSVAAIIFKNDKKTSAFKVGDEIMSKATVIKIARRKVILKETSSGDLTYIDIKADEGEDKFSAQVAKGSGVRIVDEGHIMIDRNELNSELSNMNQILMDAKAIPYKKNGEMVGFKLIGIRPGSLYDKIGAKNGDVIQSVNGVQMQTPADAMKLYQQLSTSQKLDFNMLRSGQNKNVVIDIR